MDHSPYTKPELLAIRPNGGFHYNNPREIYAQLRYRF
jgi:hypothetical protein